MHIKFLAAPLLLACGVAAAQDVSLLAGALNNNMVHERSFAAQLGFSQRFSPYTSIGAEYYNEGHPSKHHRDGLSTQFWLHTPIPEKGASFGIGVGPYYFFDTTTGLGAASDYRNLHGWGSLTSVSMKWHLEKRIYVEARFNHVKTHGFGDSNSIVAGLGYELRNVPEDVRDRNQAPGDRMIIAQFGQAIVNSFESERARAYGLQYRGTVTQNMEWSTSLLNEGRIGLVQRRGATAQLWLLRPFTDRTVLELGVGGYLMRDRINRSDATEESKTNLVPIASIGARYRLSPDWRAQLTWSRVITPYHRDSDVLLLGIGKVF